MEVDLPCSENTERVYSRTTRYGLLQYVNVVSKLEQHDLKIVDSEISGRGFLGLSQSGISAHGFEVSEPSANSSLKGHGVEKMV